MSIKNIKSIIPLPKKLSKVELGLYTSLVQAGFPSPADEHLDKPLDINDHLIDHPAATFLVRAAGFSMVDAGIYPDDILVVDKSLTAVHNDIVMAMVDNEYTIKRLYYRQNQIRLIAENKDFNSININSYDELVIWGVVTGVVRKLK